MQELPFAVFESFWLQVQDVLYRLHTRILTGFESKMRGLGGAGGRKMVYIGVGVAAVDPRPPHPSVLDQDPRQGDGGAGDEDRSLESVDRLAVAVAGDRRDQAGRLGRALGAAVHEGEAAGAVRVLGLAGAEAALTEERRLLVARDPRERDRDPPRERGGGLAVGLGRADDAREHLERDAERLAEVAGTQCRQFTSLAGAYGTSVSR